MAQEVYEQIIEKHIREFNETMETQSDTYFALARAATPLDKPVAPIMGREKQLQDLRLNLRNPEKANVILLGEPGTGKSALVQGFTHNPSSTQYLTLNINVDRLVANPEGDKDSEMANGLMDLVDQTVKYSKAHDLIAVLFMDEFHQIAMDSPSAVEALKPILVRSAELGFRIIAATTFEEYDREIAPNRALDQRLLRMDLPELTREAVINVLVSRAKRHHVEKITDPMIYAQIYDAARQYLPSNAQPRASIDILTNMIANATIREYMKNGELHREYGTPAQLGIEDKYVLSRPMLNQVILRAYSIDIDNVVDVDAVKHAIRTKIFNQDQAVETIISHLEMSMEEFNDYTRPKISFLSTGPTGTGKSIKDDELIPVPTKSGWVRNGDLKVGDKVFNRKGEPVNVTGVYHKGLRTIYRMTLSDGRTIDSAADHIWTYRSRHGNGAKKWKNATTKELMEKRIATPRDGGRIEYNYVIPQNNAVQRVSKKYRLDPYVLGALIGNGSFRRECVTYSSQDLENVQMLAEILNVDYKEKEPSNPQNYTWLFVAHHMKKYDKLLQTQDVLAEVPDLINQKSDTKFIPDIYKVGSIDQRWALIQGLFDTDGTIQNTDRANVSYSTTSKRLAHDVQEVLWSLGIMSSIKKYSNKRDWNESETFEYHVHVKVQNKDKAKFFRLGRKHDRAIRATQIVKKREKQFDTIAITSIEKLDEKVPMTCIMVDDDEHLYQAGVGHIVTHNTELAKVISDAMHIPLKRFDMSGYSNPEDAQVFAEQLAQAAWSAPNAYILIDEAEKSTRQCMNILLQVLDDARLSAKNNANRIISFAGNIINLTTNLGSEVYQHKQRFDAHNDWIDPQEIYKSLAKNDKFETSVLGRIDAIAPFRALPKKAMASIANKFLWENLNIRVTSERQMFVSPDIIPYIVIDRTSNDSEQGGARDAKRNVKNLVVQKVAHYLTKRRPPTPLSIHLNQTPRFRDAHIGDPRAADVTVEECYSKVTMDKILMQLSQKVGRQLYNKGLFIPKTWTGQEIVLAIMKVYQAGYVSFKSTVDIDKTVIISGDANLDIANNARLIK